MIYAKQLQAFVTGLSVAACLTAATTAHAQSRAPVQRQGAEAARQPSAGDRKVIIPTERDRPGRASDRKVIIPTDRSAGANGR